MLEQCMETLDQQNYVLNEQAEELALLRAKMRHFEYLMDAYKLSKGIIHLWYYEKILITIGFFRRKSSSTKYV